MNRHKTIDWTPAGERQLVEFLCTAGTNDAVLVLIDTAESVLVFAALVSKRGIFSRTFYVYDDDGDCTVTSSPGECLTYVRAILGPPRSEGEA